MSVIVKLRFTKGDLKDKVFCFEQKDKVVIGRSDDCDIVIPESSDSVSRRHCVLDITPQTVKVKDLDSKNGTFLNGRKISQRDLSSAKSIGKKQNKEFKMKSGDHLGLGCDCEIVLVIRKEKAKRGKCKRCDICDAKVDEAESSICELCRNDSLAVIQYLLAMADEGVCDLQKLAGYRRDEMLNKRGQVSVWLINEVKTGRQRVLKLFVPNTAIEDDVFIREAFNIGQFNHQNFVRHLSSGNLGDIYYILMEHCQGGSVTDLMNNNRGKLDLYTATYIILQVLDGLIYASSVPLLSKIADGSTKEVKGIVHRDIKPGNILLSDTSYRPVVKIADFGLAKAFETAGKTIDTKRGQFGGSLRFMSRQQLENYRYAKPIVDVWSTAASYYYMITKNTPRDFREMSDIATVQLCDPVPIQKRDPNIPKKLANVIDAALSEQPKTGIKKAFEFKKAIEEAFIFYYGYSVGSLVDIGRRRNSNQDEVVICPESGFFAVTDGMGGLTQGGETSRMISRKMPELMNVAQKKWLTEPSPEYAFRLLKEQVGMLSDKIYNTYNNATMGNYGATLSGVWLKGGTALFVNIGDSRGYLLPHKMKRIIQITNDHNIAAQLVQHRKITKEEARYHKSSSILTSFVGMQTPAKPDVFVKAVQPGDMILLCSDGLYGMVDDSVLQSIMRSSDNPEDVCKRLVEEANENGGGRDNISVVLIKITGANAVEADEV